MVMLGFYQQQVDIQRNLTHVRLQGLEPVCVSVSMLRDICSCRVSSCLTGLWLTGTWLSLWPVIIRNLDEPAVTACLLLVASTTLPKTETSSAFSSVKRSHANRHVLLKTCHVFDACLPKVS